MLSVLNAFYEWYYLSSSLCRFKRKPRLKLWLYRDACQLCYRANRLLIRFKGLLPSVFLQHFIVASRLFFAVLFDPQQSSTLCGSCPPLGDRLLRPPSPTQPQVPVKVAGNQPQPRLLVQQQR